MLPARRAPQRSLIKEAVFPAPMGGLNSVASLAAMPKGDAIFLWNLVGQELGLRTRLGYYEHAVGFRDRTGVPFEAATVAWTAGATILEGQVRVNGSGQSYIATQAGLTATEPTGTGTGIADGTVLWDSYTPAGTPPAFRTIMPFNGSVSTASKLFAVNTHGIYDVTAGGPDITTPVAIAFPSVDAAAGRGYFHAFVSIAGHFLFYCDEKWGAYIYVETTNTWTRITTGAGALQVTGIDPSKAVFCTVWKHRLYLVERGTATAWYLDLDAIQGTTTQLSFAGKFAAGGYLVGLWSWTHDGGAGPDDRLVALSSAGDVVIYEGTDPTDVATFKLSGIWQVGALPSGRRVATEVGGDLLLATGVGLLPLSKLVTGLVTEDRQQYVTFKIGSLFSGLVSSYGAEEGWWLKVHPQDNSLIVNYPKGDGVFEQLVMSLATKGWSRYRGLPMQTGCNYLGKFYFGTPDGRVCVNDGYVDDVRLSDPTTYTSVPFAGITAYDRLGSTRQKRVELIRGNVTSDGRPPNYRVEARYKYDTSEVYGGDLASVVLGAVWDSAKWDVDAWPGAADYTPEQRIVGAVGMGPEVALAFSGKASSRVVIVGFDVFFTEGGVL